MNKEVGSKRCPSTVERKAIRAQPIIAREGIGEVHHYLTLERETLLTIFANAKTSQEQAACNII